MELYTLMLCRSDPLHSVGTPRERALRALGTNTPVSLLSYCMSSCSHSWWCNDVIVDAVSHCSGVHPRNGSHTASPSPACTQAQEKYQDSMETSFSFSLHSVSPLGVCKGAQSMHEVDLAGSNLFQCNAQQMFAMLRHEGSATTLAVHALDTQHGTYRLQMPDACLPNGNGSVIVQVFVGSVNQQQMYCSNPIPLVVCQSTAVLHEVQQTQQALPRLTGCEFHQMCAFLHLLGRALGGHASEGVLLRLIEKCTQQGWSATAEILGSQTLQSSHYNAPNDSISSGDVPHKSEGKEQQQRRQWQALVHCYVRLAILLLFGFFGVRTSASLHGFPPSAQLARAIGAPIALNLTTLVKTHCSSKRWTKRLEVRLHLFAMTLIVFIWTPLSAFLSLAQGYVVKRRGFADALISASSSALCAAITLPLCGPRITYSYIFAMVACVALFYRIVEQPWVYDLCIRNPDDVEAKFSRSCDTHLKDYSRLASSYFLCCMAYWAIEYSALQLYNGVLRKQMLSAYLSIKRHAKKVAKA